MKIFMVLLHQISILYRVKLDYRKIQLCEGTMEITLNIPDVLVQSLQEEADELPVSLNDLIIAILAGYFEEVPDIPDEEILASIERGMRQALTGDYRDAHEVLDEIERDLGLPSSREKM